MILGFIYCKDTKFESNSQHYLCFARNTHELQRY